MSQLVTVAEVARIAGVTLTQEDLDAYEADVLAIAEGVLQRDLVKRERTEPLQCRYDGAVYPAALPVDVSAPVHAVQDYRFEGSFGIAGNSGDLFVTPLLNAPVIKEDRIYLGLPGLWMSVTYTGGFDLTDAPALLKRGIALGVGQLVKNAAASASDGLGVSPQVDQLRMGTLQYTAATTVRGADGGVLPKGWHDAADLGAAACRALSNFTRVIVP